MTTSEKLVTLCEARGIKPAALGRDVLKIPRTSMHNLVSGRAAISLPLALQVSRYFNVSMEYLADDAIQSLPPAPDPLLEKLLWLADQIGYELAIRRMTAAGDSRPPIGQSYAEISAAQELAASRGPKLKRS